MAMTDLQKELWKEYVRRKIIKANIELGDANKILEWVMENRMELTDDASMQEFVDAERAVEAQNAIDQAKALLQQNGINVEE